jgi:hypothetical protein
MTHTLEMWIKNGETDYILERTPSNGTERQLTLPCPAAYSEVESGLPGVKSVGEGIRCGSRTAFPLVGSGAPSVRFGCNAHSTQLQLAFHALLNFALRWSCRCWWVMWLSIVRLVKLDRSWACLSVIYICTKCLLKADFFTGFELCSRIIQLRNRLICSPWLTAPFASSLSDSSCFKAEHRWMLPSQ